MPRRRTSDECAALRPRLADLAAGALSAREAERVRDHTETCDGCARELRSLEDIGHLLDGLGTQPPPERMWAGIAPHLGSRRARWVPALASAAGVAAIALIVVFAGTPHRPLPAAARVGSYDVVAVSELADDQPVFALYARESVHGQWLGSAASVVYGNAVGEETGG
jgi:anti-sigma factor RsiW